MNLKRITAFLTTGMLAFTAVSPLFASAESEITTNIFDLKRMRNAVTGDFTSQTESIFSVSDLTSDESVDSLDLALMRRNIASLCGNITKDIKLADRFGPLEFPEGTYKEGVITSVEELLVFLEPDIVIDPEEADYSQYQLVYDSEREEFLSLYTEEFFEDNVLFIRAMNQAYSGVELYEIGDVFYEGDALKIQYNEKYYGGILLCTFNGLFAQVTMPKALYDDSKSVVWEETEKRYVSCTVDTTSAAEHTAFQTALSGNSSQFITSADELDTWLEGKFRSAVCDSMRSTYTEEFFSEYVLCVDLYAKEFYDNWLITPTFEYDYSKGEFTFRYSREYGKITRESEIIITQGIVPKTLYTEGDTASVVRDWETPVEAVHIEFDEGTYAELYDTVLSDYFFDESAWIDTDGELDAWLAEHCTEEGITLLKNNLFTKSLDDYSAYVWIDTDVMGSSHTLHSAYYGDEGLTLYFGDIQPFSDIGGNYIHVLYTDKQYSGADVVKETFCFNEDNFVAEGDVIFYDKIYGSYGSVIDPSYFLVYNTLMINQYTFRDETHADIYIAEAGGGPVQYSGYTYVGTLELEKDYFPFDEEYTCEYTADTDWGYLLGITDMESAVDGYIYTGDNYIIGLSSAGIYVEYSPCEGETITERFVF